MRCALLATAGSSAKRKLTTMLILSRIIVAALKMEVTRILLRGVFLYTTGSHDAVTLGVTPPEGIDEDHLEDFYVTLKGSLLQGMQIALNLGESEVEGLILSEKENPGRSQILLYETAEGGTGAVKAFSDTAKFTQIVTRAREILHEGNEKSGCVKACYECLLNFHNQREHEQLDRSLVLPLLRTLDECQCEIDRTSPAT